MLADLRFRSFALLAPLLAIGCSAGSDAQTGRVQQPVLVIGKQLERIVAADGKEFDRLGESVSISGTTVIVGAKKHGVGGVDNVGAAYVYAQSGKTWTQLAKLLASDGAKDDYFGTSVAISGTTAVVGTDRAAYVFVQSGTTWAQQAKLAPTDPATADAFGGRVAIDSGRIIVGAAAKTVGTNVHQGAAYVFVQSGTTWTQEAKLVASDGAAEEFFTLGGVALSGSLALVGSPRAGGKGAGYVFVRSGTTWSQQAKLVADDGAAGDELGSVALSGTTALIGAPEKNLQQGAAYVFTQSGTTWAQQAKLMSSDAAPKGRFGHSVALAGTTALVGRPTSAVYVFEQKGATWAQQNVLKAEGSGANDAFGWSVATTPTIALVGDWNYAVGAEYSQGAAYAFATAHTDGDPCATVDDCLSGFCVTGVCCESACVGQCTTGKCVDGAVCEGNVLKSPGGTDKSCAPYVCRDAACLPGCDSSSDCVEGSVCDPATRACSSSATPASESDGGCTMGTSRGWFGGGALVVLALGLARRRRAR